MDPQMTFNPRGARNESQSSNDRQLAESYHLRQNMHTSIQESSQSHHSHQNLDPTLSEQSGLPNRFPIMHQSVSSPSTPLHQHETLPKLRTSAALHFEYHTRYPSPPSTEANFPTRSTNPLNFTYPSPSDQRSMRDQVPNDRRTASSPPQHPSPILNHTQHRVNGSSSSAGNSPVITLPPLSSVPHRPPTYRGVDQPPNHQHVEIRSPPATQRRPSITQVLRDNPEQAPLRRYTMDSSHVPDQQKVSLSDGRRRTLSSLPPPGYPVQPHRPPQRLGTQQLPPQPGQTNPNSRPYSSPPPLPTHRSDNPPTSAISSTSPSPSMSRPPQPPQPPHPLSQPPTTDEPPPIIDTSAVETIDTALEPLRLGFENAWVETVQNVRQVVTKMQKDLTRLIAAERRKNANLMRCLVNSSEKFRNQEWAMEELRKENGLLTEKAIENGRLRRENVQQVTVIDALNQGNSVLRRENVELKKKNDEMREALLRVTGRVFQYKEELAKVKADAETFRICREADSTNDVNSQTTTVPSALHHREMARLHAERERERIFNDAVKQLRALTALEESAFSNPQNPDTTREHESEEVMIVETASALSDIVHRDHDRRTRPLSLEVSTSTQNPSLPSVVAEVHYTINEPPGQSKPPPPAKVVSINDGDKSRMEADEADGREMVGIEMDGNDDDDDVSIIPPTTNIRVMALDPVAIPDAEPLENDVHTLGQQMRPTDEEESELQLEVEAQRQRQRQARRGSTSTSTVTSPHARSRKSSSTASRTGMKRNRDAYEADQVGKDHDVGINESGMTGGERRMEVRMDPAQIVHSPNSAEADEIRAGVEKSEESEIMRGREQKDVDITGKDKTRETVATNGRQVTPPMETQMPMTPLSNKPAKDGHPKTLGRWSYYTHFRDNGVPLPPTSSFITQQFTPPPLPSPPAQRPQKRHPKLGINHMDLLYKTEKEVMVCRICLSLEQNPDATAAERRKARANTKKFPLNASWADLINHCQTEHSKACEDMEKLSPSQIAEMKQRMPPVASTR